VGLTPGSYEAFCFDQAVWYFGTSLQSELEQVGMKKSSEEASNEATRKRILNRFLGTPEEKQQYMDPSVLFGTG
jgi:hypothetical protein